jgi:hypothetical protein
MMFRMGSDSKLSADIRQQIANSRKQIKDGRQQTADGKW